MSYFVFTPNRNKETSRIESVNLQPLEPDSRLGNRFILSFPNEANAKEFVSELGAFIDDFREVCSTELKKIVRVYSNSFYGDNVAIFSIDQKDSVFPISDLSILEDLATSLIDLSEEITRLHAQFNECDIKASDIDNWNNRLNP